MKKGKVIVIGAGLGGLSAAISLRSAGFEVEIFEKNHQLGGKLNVKEIDGYTFDLGPSIFTLPEIFRDLFKRADRKMEDYFQLERVSPQWRNFFEDRGPLDLWEEMDRMKDELKKLPGDPEKHWREFQNFLEYGRKQYNVVESGYFEKGLDTTWEMIRHYGIFGLWLKMDWNTSMDKAIHKRISDPHMRLIFEYFIKYVGSSARDAPGYMNMMSLIQFDHGLWYVKGGMYELAKGLGRLLDELGIKAHLGTGVSEIRKEGNQVKGITLEDGSKHVADFVVSNMEVLPTMKKLLKEDQKTISSYEKFKPACSGLVVHLGTDRLYPQLAHHNFFYSKDQNKHFDTVFRDGKLPEDPTIYLVAPTRTDPSKAPEGGDNIKVLPHIPPIDPENPLTPEDYQVFQDKVLTKLERMGLTDLRKHAVVTDTLTPLDLEEMYQSNRGSIYGVASDWKTNQGFKAPKQSEDYENLYYVGGTVNPGGGMPMVVLSGMKACDRLLARHFPDSA